jgi:hypothetical protein
MILMKRRGGKKKKGLQAVNDSCRPLTFLWRRQPDSNR